MNLRGRYSVDEFENLVSLDRDYTDEENTIFEKYSEDFDDMIKYEDFLLPSLRVELMKYRNSINDWSMQDDINEHKRAAIDAYEKNMNIQEQLGYERVNRLVLKKKNDYNNFGFSSVIQILAITLAGISVLVLMTLMLV